MTVVENNKELVPFEHYTGLFAKLDPVEAAARCGVKYDPDRGTIAVRLLYVDYEVTWPEFSIRSDNPDGLALKSLPAQMLIIRYLLEGKASVGSGAFLTYREMPWGDVYLKPFTGRCITRAAFTFGTKVARFAAACEKMGAIRLPHGDAGYQFDFLGCYRMQIMVYAGDDEFPPSAQVLYSDNFESGFAAEDRVVAGDLLITSIKKEL